MKPHLRLAHLFFEEIVNPCDIIIDATCGNGHDTLKLATLAHLGKVFALDIQEEAIRKTKENLKQFQNIHYTKCCHSTFPSEILPNSVKLIVYNLGYLPGSNKEVKTQAETTIKSLKQALILVKPQGWISLMCYPGHYEGEIEQNTLLQFCKTLDYKKWCCCYHNFINCDLSPNLLTIQCLRG